MPLTRAQLRALARERRALHVEGLLATVATAGLLAASSLELPVLALAPALVLYGAMTIGWVVRYVALLGRSCPFCGDLFFYSVDRLLTSLPYLSTRCAHCDERL
jgi:hypothetical protein